MERKQHSKSSWIDAGLSTLIKHGAQALRAEPLAKMLGTTKGSFYWHFSDVPTFQTAVIDSWRNDTLTGIVSHLSASGSSEQRLRAFGEQILDDFADPAMRAWGKSNPHAADAIEQIDEQRITYISTLLANLGFANPAFALACYSALIGAPTIRSKATSQDAFTALVDLVLALK